MYKTAGNNAEMENLMAASNDVKFSWIVPFWKSNSVENCAKAIYENANDPRHYREFFQDFWFIDEELYIEQGG